jgi:hypothetical protein
MKFYMTEYINLNIKIPFPFTTISWSTINPMGNDGISLNLPNQNMVLEWCMIIAMQIGLGLRRIVGWSHGIVFIFPVTLMKFGMHGKHSFSKQLSKIFHPGSFLVNVQ